MKTIMKICMAVSVMAVMSCTKDNVSVTLQKEVIYKMEDMIPVSFDVEAPVAPVADGTKVSHAADGTSHSFAWEAGDSFSMFGYISDYGGPDKDEVLLTFHNFSANPFTYAADDGKWSGYFPNLSEIYTLSDPTGNPYEAKLNYLGIYPAASEVSLNMYDATNTRFMVDVKGCTIPETQDGSGFPYCIFLCRTGKMSSKWMSIGGNESNSPKFSLGNLVVRMSLESSKKITKLEVSTEDGYNLVGNLTQLEYQIQNGGAAQIYRGCATKKLTVFKDGEALPSDLYLAIRQLENGKTYTFKFTAEDGTTYTQALKAKAPQQRKIVNLGTVSIPDESWE